MPPRKRAATTARKATPAKAAKAATYRATRHPLDDATRANLTASTEGTTSRYGATNAAIAPGVAACHRCATYTGRELLVDVDGVPTCPACREEVDA